MKTRKPLTFDEYLGGKQKVHKMAHLLQEKRKLSALCTRTASSMFFLKVAMPLNMSHASFFFPEFVLKDKMQKQLPFAHLFIFISQIV